MSSANNDRGINYAGRFDGGDELSPFFTEKDRARFTSLGQSEDAVRNQIHALRRERRPLVLDRPCGLDDGIICLREDEVGDLLKSYDDARRKGRVMKFVPASGAASRMFEPWYRLKESDDAAARIRFLRELPRYPFYPDLGAVMRHDQASDDPNDREAVEVILDRILGSPGLRLGERPKALIPFHRYSDDDRRTPLEEHLREGALHAADGRGLCRLHLTVSPEHQLDVASHFERVRQIHERHLSVSFDLSLSPQHPSTHTIAVTTQGEPFRDDDGALLFRPGGHGSLLKNLSELDGDIVFIKNIDNVVPDDRLSEVVWYKKLLGGCLLKAQKRAFGYLRRLESEHRSAGLVAEIETFCREELCLRPPPDYGKYRLEEQADYLFRTLNRPFRVCGMVKNEGEPGGGPFWVAGQDGSLSLQIVEHNEIDRDSEEQQLIWKASTHFNPVDLVCGLRDYRGRAFDLFRFRNDRSSMTSTKSYRGRPLKALEHPGLWNGSMARWNTIFVEVPLHTFAPVKTVEDLLRPEHRAAASTIRP